jgi:hypothetical protein
MVRAAQQGDGVPAGLDCLALADRDAPCQPVPASCRPPRRRRAFPWWRAWWLRWCGPRWFRGRRGVHREDVRAAGHRDGEASDHTLAQQLPALVRGQDLGVTDLIGGHGSTLTVGHHPRHVRVAQSDADRRPSGGTAEAWDRAVGTGGSRDQTNPRWPVEHAPPPGLDESRAGPLRAAPAPGSLCPVAGPRRAATLACTASACPRLSLDGPRCPASTTRGRSAPASPDPPEARYVSLPATAPMCRPPLAAVAANDASSPALTDVESAQRRRRASSGQPSQTPAQPDQVASGKR